jgi:hypothetical protein
MKFRIWSAAALILLLASCSQGSAGIFATVQREQKVHSTGGLSSVATVTHMTQLNGVYYIAGGGTLFYRKYTDTSWTSLTTSYGGHTYNHFMGVGLVGSSTTGTLYAVANYNATDSNMLFSSTNGTSWSAVTALPSSVIAETLVPIMHQNTGNTSTELLLNVAPAGSGDDPTYQTIYIITTSGISSAISLGSNAFTYPITGAAYDDSQAQYYFVNNVELFNVSGTYPSFSLALVTLSTSLSSNNALRDILMVPTSIFTSNSSAYNVIVSSSKGSLYFGNLSGTTWTDVGNDSNVRDDSTTNDLVAFDRLLYEDESGNQYIWIGTLNGVSAQGAGYGTLSTTSGISVQPPAGTDTNNYDSTVLPTSQVMMLYKDNVNSPYNFFLGTGSQGLWKWSSQEWSQE